MLNEKTAMSFQPQQSPQGRRDKISASSPAFLWGLKSSGVCRVSLENVTLSFQESPKVNVNDQRNQPSIDQQDVAFVPTGSKNSDLEFRPYLIV